MRRMVIYRGWTIGLFLSFVPVVFWVSMGDLSGRFNSSVIALQSIGQISGLVGMAMMSVTLVLSGRLKLFDRFLGGVPQAYQIHQRFGQISFFLLIIHPLMLAGSYAVLSPGLAIAFLLPNANLPVNLGKISLFLMTVLIGLTVWRKVPYHIWKWTHRGMGIALFFGGLHMLFIPSDVSVNPLLKWYLLILAGIGILVYGYRTVLGRFLVSRSPYTVRRVRSLGGSLVEFELTPDDKPIRYRPGQFVFIRFLWPGYPSEYHPFSLTSDPRGTSLNMIVKSLGDDTSRMKMIPEQTPALIEGPYGVFTPPGNSKRKMCWIAGGIGITPFISMVRSGRDWNVPVEVYYLVPTEQEAVCQDLFRKRAKADPAFSFRLYCSRKEGRFGIHVFTSRRSELKQADYYLSGPAGLVASLASALSGSGVPDDQIHTEFFSFR